MNERADAEPTSIYAVMLATSGRVTSALEVYDQLLGRDAEDAESWLQKGLLHQDLSDFVAAQQALERARVIAPDDARIHFHLGLVAASFGRVLAAVEHFRAAQALDPDNGELKINLANALLVLGRWQAAAAIVEPMGDGLPGWWASTRDSVMGSLAKGRARVQELIARRNSSGAPLERSLALELAGLSINVGRVPMALQICQRLLAEDAADLEVVRLQAKALAQSEGIAAALTMLDAAKDQFDSQPDYEMAVAQLCFEADDLERALRHAATGKDADRRAYGMMMLAARRWPNLFGFCRSWMAQTDDTGPFALLLRALAGLGRLRLFRDDMRGQPRAGTIPPVIAQFWDSETVPDDVAAAIATWRDRNRGFEHRLFNEATARAFIERTHGERAAVAFDRCHHPAMKADFFRVAYLASEGGLYIDADDACVRPLVELLGAISGAGFAASFSGDVAPYVHNWFLAAAPGAPVLKLALADMIDGIDRAHARGIKADIWHTTGPGLITRSVARWLAENPGAGGEAVFLTTRQYRGFATSIEDLEYKKTTAGNWRRSEEKPMTVGATAFDAIYDEESWGNGSGPGSHPNWTIEYRSFLEKFIRMNNVRSIVDVGCGDWQFSRFLNLDGISYHGFDVVERLIDANTKRHGSKSIRFDVMPEDPAQLPQADLLLMKDVLQHLPDADIFRFRDTVFQRYRFALLTNSFEKIDAYRNVDLSRPGEFRCLDLTAAPYDMPGAYLFEYFAQPWERIRTFLVGRPSQPGAPAI